MRLRIKNFEKFHPRSDYKSLPWIRFETDTLEGEGLWGIPLATRYLWVFFLCQAGRKNQAGVFSGNVEYLAERSGVDISDVEFAIKVFVERDMLEVIEDDVREPNVSRTPDERDPDGRRTPDVREPNDRRSLRTNERTNVTNIKSTSDEADPTPDCQAFVDLWNANCSPLSKVTKLTDGRRRQVRARLRDEPNLEYWASVVRRMASSDLCRDSGWANFDWLVKNDTNHVKAAEGKYDNRAKPEQANATNIAKLPNRNAPPIVARLEDLEEAE